MKLFTFYVYAAALCVACSCNSQNRTAESVDKAVGDTAASNSSGDVVFEKLLGTWQSDDGKSFERWTKRGEDGYQSVAYSINGKDTTWNERAIIYKIGTSWVFENTVTGQNEGKAVKFTSTKLNENMVQFTNPQHDFPNDINYTVKDPSTLNAFIVGKNKNNGLDTIPFNFKRVL